MFSAARGSIPRKYATTATTMPPTPRPPPTMPMPRRSSTLPLARWLPSSNLAFLSLSRAALGGGTAADERALLAELLASGCNLRRLLLPFLVPRVEQLCSDLATAQAEREPERNHDQRDRAHEERVHQRLRDAELVHRDDDREDPDAGTGRVGDPLGMPETRARGRATDDARRRIGEQAADHEHHDADREVRQQEEKLAQHVRY